MTRWAKDVSPDKAIPEYPRPQMVRKDWLNLNGLWNYSVVARDQQPASFQGDILVPFPIEAPLSGVGRMINSFPGRTYAMAHPDKRHRARQFWNCFSFPPASYSSTIP
jgi:hypothetical protein